MILQMFSILDKALGAYRPPHPAHTEAQAVRAFGDLLEEPQLEFFKHPTDYSLHHVGEWDDGLGLFSPAEHKRLVVEASALLALKSPQS